jgi:hypothetical protein
MKESAIAASTQGALPPPNVILEPKIVLPARPSQPREPDEPKPARAEPSGWSVLDIKEKTYLRKLWRLRPSHFQSFEHRERANLLALTGMTAAQFDAGEVTPSLLEWLRPKTRWADRTPLGYVRMKETQTAVINGKNVVFPADKVCGIGIDFDSELASAFIRNGVALVVPTQTLRALCTQWPGGIGTIIPPSRQPMFKNANGVEVMAGGNLVEPEAQYYRGDLILYPRLIPLKAATDFIDHRIRHSLDHGLIEILSEGRLTRDIATLPPCPLPAEKVLPEGDSTDRRAWVFQHMKASPSLDSHAPFSP